MTAVTPNSTIHGPTPLILDSVIEKTSDGTHITQEGIDSDFAICGAADLKRGSP